MFKKGKAQYIIKTVPSDSTLPLQNLLNEMSEQGWELYSMQEVEGDEGFVYNCIFVKDTDSDGENSFDDVVNITAFKSQMEKMLSAKLTPYETCREIQSKIREQKKKIANTKNQLEKEDAGSDQRKVLNDKMSASLKELENLQQKLVRSISPDSMYSTMQTEKFSIHLNEEILEFVSPDSENDLLSETVKVRQKLTDEVGYVIPKIVFKDDEYLAPYEFSINVRGLNVFNSFVYPNHLMYFQDELNLPSSKKNVHKDTDIITDKKIVWVEESKTKDFWQKGITPSEYIARAVEYVAIKYIEELFDYADVNKYIEMVAEKNPYLVENIMPDFISVAELRYILVNLIKENVSVRDIVYIFEKINDFSDEASKEDLLDKIRYAMSKFITSKYVNVDNTIQGFELSEKTLDLLFTNANSGENIVRIDGTKAEKIANKIIKEANKYDVDKIIIALPMEIRHMTYIVLSQYINNLVILAQEEVTNYYNFETLETI